MDKSEFDDYFAELGKTGDRAQSVLYVFIVVYIAMLLYGLTAFTVTSRRGEIAVFVLAEVSIVRWLQL